MQQYVLQLSSLYFPADSLLGLVQPSSAGFFSEMSATFTGTPVWDLTADGRIRIGGQQNKSKL